MTWLRKLLITLILSTLIHPLLPNPVRGQERSEPIPCLDEKQLTAIAGIVQRAIRSGRNPRAVVLIGNQGRIVYRRAFGPPFAPNREELFPAGSYGHTGFTGTSIHPSLGSHYEAARSTRIHRFGEGKVQTGIDLLKAQKFEPLWGLRIGLITNHSGLDSDGRRTIDLLYDAPRVKLVAIFVPEHGLSGSMEGKIPSSTDPKTGLPVYSLYGETNRPSEKMLKGLDALVFDIQEVGVRFYTYITTMGYVMEALAKKGLAFYVLDRPNPITASVVQGPVMDGDLKSFVGYFPMPIRHGMTVGELASMFNAENRIGANLNVIRMRGYQRTDWYDETGLLWINPSPNLRTLNQTILYPGVAMVEGANVSVGRGTNAPFELLGAPWIKGRELADYLNGRKIQGVRFMPVDFIPRTNRFENQLCHGIRIVLVDRQSLDSPGLGIEIASALYRLYPDDFQIDKTLPLIGSREVLQAIKEGQDPVSIAQSWQASLEMFRKIRSKYLLY